MKTVFWFIPLSRKEKQIKAEETSSLDNTLPLINLDSFAKLWKLLCIATLNHVLCIKHRWGTKIDEKIQHTYKAVAFG